jgi:LPS sulfotransferase NodH
MTSSPAFARQGYAICTTPRSGSNYLCQLLESTDALGRPREFFNGPARRILDDPTYPDNPEEQIQRIRTMGATSNGIYGVKVFPFQHDQIQAHVSWTRELPGLSFIHLQRSDLLGQAISWTRAVQTGRYRSTQVAVGDAVYDADAIYEHLLSLCILNARWSAFFARTGKRLLTIEYEALIESPTATITSIARLLGVGDPIALNPALIDLEMQRDRTSAEWKERFIAERGDPNAVDTLERVSQA